MKALVAKSKLSQKHTKVTMTSARLPMIESASERPTQDSGRRR